MKCNETATSEVEREARKSFALSGAISAQSLAERIERDRKHEESFEQARQRARSSRAESWSPMETQPCEISQTISSLDLAFDRARARAVG